jgi:sugar transferase (PEP-CTERM/EpsH1 system associated)
MERKLNILFVSATIPYPAIDGGRIRVLSLIQNLSKFNKITFLTYNSSDKDEQGIKYLRDIGIDIIDIKWNYNNTLSIMPSVFKQVLKGKPLTIAKYYSSATAKKINELLDTNSYDILHLEMLHAGQYITEISDRHNTKIILDQQNIDSLIWQRLVKTEKNLFRKLMLNWQYKSFLNIENKMSSMFDVCVCVSEEDAERLKSINPNIKTDVVPNGVDIDYFFPSETPENEKQIVFVGSMDWSPNEDAALYFCDQIFPLIKAKIPDIKFYIVGSNPTDRILKLKGIEGIIVTGLVDDVRSYISQSAVFVVPLRIGGGTRLKILQALAMKKAIVSTSVGCEGLGLTHNEHLLINDNPDEFADSVIRLTKDKLLRHNLGENGRNLVQNQYDWKTISLKLDAVYRKAIEQVSENYRQ